MEAFFVPKRDEFSGRPRTTLPTVINKDLIHMQAGELQLKTKNDLVYGSIAEDRT